MTLWLAIAGCATPPAEEVAAEVITSAADGTPLEAGPAGDGPRDGTVLRWFEDGAFRSSVTWVAGEQHGPRVEVGLDGRLVELALEHGRVVSLRTLPAGTPMPEWVDGAQVEGTRYGAHAERLSSTP